jgi:hypothetical protein
MARKLSACEAVAEDTLHKEPTPNAMFDVADVDEEIRQLPQDMERVSARMNLNTGAIIVKRRNSDYGDYGETLMQTPGPVILTDVEFRVQDKSHEKVVEEGSRDVCAYAVGKYIRDFRSGAVRRRILEVAEKDGTPIRYNPFRSKYFHKVPNLEGEIIPVEGADKLVLWSQKEQGQVKGRMNALRADIHQDAL